MRRATSRALVFACVLLGAHAVPVSAAVSPENRPAIAKTFHHPDLWVREHQEKLSELSSSIQSAAAAELASLGARNDVGFYDSRTGRFVSLILSQPLIPGTGKGNTLRWDSGALPSNSTIQERTWSAAQAWLAAHQPELRLDPSEFGTPRITVHEKGALVYVYVPRIVNGVKVRDCSLAMTINHGNLVLFGLQNWGDVSASLAPALAPDQARAVATDHAAPFSATFEKAARLELVPESPDDASVTYRLAWVVNLRLSGDIGNWEAVVDAQTGELLNFEDKNQYAERRIFGGVYPVSNDQRVPDGVEQTGWPMSYADFSDGADTFFTDQGGNMGCIVGSLSTAFQGRFLKMTDTCGAMNESSTGDIDLESGPLASSTDCTVPAGHSLGDTKSSRSGFFELNQLIQEAKGWLPNNTWVDGQLNSNMNLNQTCNAFWDGGSINFFKSGGGCRNTGEIAAIFDHEWGHGLDNNNANPTISSPGEAVADITAVTRLDESCIGRGFFVSGVCSGYGDACDGTPATGCTGVRDVDFMNHRCDLPHTITWILSGFAGGCASGSPTAPACPAVGSRGPCNRETHCEGMVGAETYFDLKARDLVSAPYNLDANTALEITTRLYLLGLDALTSWYTCSVGGGCGATGGYLLTLAADDDNGDLNDGTPHMTGIRSAFERHQIHCATPVVQDSGCAGGPTEAPDVTVTATDKGAIVSWDPITGADSYDVYRTDGVFACDFGKIKVGNTTDTTFNENGLQNGRTYYYSVIAVGANTACFSPMSACQTVVPLAGPNLAADEGHLEAILSGDGDAFLDNCEQAEIGFSVSNNGTGDLTNVQLISVTPLTHPLTTIDTPLPLLVTADLDECTAASGSFLATFHGMSFGEVTQLELEFSADGITGTRTTIVTIVGVETDSSPVATRTYAFEADLNGWTVTTGIYTRKAPGANGTAFHLSSSENIDNVCDIVASPTVMLTGTSTLSLYNRYTTETPIPIPYDRANVGVRDITTNARTTIIPSSGRLYDLPPGSPNGVCVTNGQAGWAGTNASFATSSWNSGALNPGGAFDGQLVNIEVAYGTDPALALAGFDFDEVTLTNFEELAADAQSDGCIAIISVAPVGLVVDPAGNRVLDPFAIDEPFIPTWENTGNTLVALTGTLSNFTGPGDGVSVTYSVSDATANYGSLDAGDIADCGADCYSLNVALIGPRPATHLDATVDETVAPLGPPLQGGNPNLKTWTVHIGSSFQDVDPNIGSNPFYPSIETILHNGVTGGCAAGPPATFCPTLNVLRQEMAPFLLKGFLGSGYVPPACTGIFGDVQCPADPGFPYSDFIEDLSTRGITGGCAAGPPALYCPGEPVTRAQMSPFLLKTLLTGGYVPPACTGLFIDVPCPATVDFPFSDFIEDLSIRGITAGCVAGPPAEYCPDNPVTREQMAAFLTLTFSLVLYGL